MRKKNGSKNQHQLLWKPISWHFITSLIQRILGAGHWCSLNSGFVLQKLGNQVLYWSCPAHGQEHGFHVSYLSYRLKNLIKRCLFQNSRRNNWQFCLSAKKALIYGALFFCCSSHFLVPSSLAEDQNLQNPSYKIQVQPAPISLDQKIQQESARSTPIIDTFNSTLFKTDLKESKKTWPALNWLFKTDIEEKRQQIKGSHQSAFESYWKIGLEGNLEEDKNNYTAILRTKLNVKVLIQLSQVFFAKAEFELLTSTGSIQKIYQRSGETNGISQREVLFLWRATNWLTMEFGSINQRFLQAPLLLADIPFPSVVGNIELYKEEKHDFAFSLQFAMPNTFATDNSIALQSITDLPILFTQSLFWNYDSKTFYNFRIGGHFFYYSPLPSDIAKTSWVYGNTIEGKPSQFIYNYTGFYFGLEPSFQIVPRLGIKLKLHYIVNISDKIKDSGLNQGVLYSAQIPIDITENIRITPILEYFHNQPDASVGYYNSERYSHSDREGFVGELVFNLYNRNISTGFRYQRSRPSLPRGSAKEGQNYYLLFLRTHYAKI